MTSSVNRLLKIYKNKYNNWHENYGFQHLCFKFFIIQFLMLLYGNINVYNRNSFSFFVLSFVSFLLLRRHLLGINVKYTLLFLFHLVPRKARKAFCHLIFYIYFLSSTHFPTKYNSSTIFYLELCIWNLIVQKFNSINIVIMTLCVPSLSMLNFSIFLVMFIKYLDVWYFIPFYLCWLCSLALLCCSVFYLIYELTKIYDYIF